MMIPSDWIDAALAESWPKAINEPHVRLRIGNAIHGVIPKIRERLLADSALKAATDASHSDLVGPVQAKAMIEAACDDAFGKES